MKKILLPTDFSAASKNAIQHALRYFSKTPVEFVLLNACGNTLGVSPDGLALYADLTKQVEANLQKLAEELTSANRDTNCQFRTVAMAVEPDLAISMMLQAEHVDWVVVGATGSEKTIRFGSVATALVRANRCHVLVIPATSQPGPLLNVVLATDYQPLGFAGAKALQDLVGNHHAQLTFLTILAKDAMTSAPDKAIREAFQSRFADLNTTEVIESHVGLQAGISNYVESHYVDLLVTASHHRSLLDVLLNRSTTCLSSSDSVSCSGR
ncbi:universal stress protein [Spirosoma aerolatum]|uniref:universal stress protein n=1 Tax=Spirosoma aerolatum TaxID=1211326 RepID=UPI0009ACC43D|nr:universal stress protein [Spirosoma aerolatum]